MAAATSMTVERNVSPKATRRSAIHRPSPTARSKAGDDVPASATNTEHSMMCTAVVTVEYGRILKSLIKNTKSSKAKPE